MIEQNVDIFHLARVIEGLPNLRAVNITATIDIDKLQDGLAIRRGQVNPAGTPCVGNFSTWGVRSVAEKAIAVRPRHGGRQFGVFLRSIRRIYGNKPGSIMISELHSHDSIWEYQRFGLGGYNFGRLDSTTVCIAALALRQIRALTLPLGEHGGEFESYSIGRCAAKILVRLTLLEHLTVQSCHGSLGDTEIILQSISP
jgi:hypothetical protein